MCRTYRKEGGVHDPFADLVGLKPVVKPSVPIRGVGSSSSLSSSGGASARWHDCISCCLEVRCDVMVLAHAMLMCSQQSPSLCLCPKLVEFVHAKRLS